MQHLAASGEVGAAESAIIKTPACEKAKEIRKEIKEYQKSDSKLQDMKAELKEAKTLCDCNFMLRCIRRYSDVDNPAWTVIRIWRRKSLSERIQIRRKEAIGV